MKAKIISEEVHDSVLDWTHGRGYKIRRLVVEEAGNLAITPHKDQVYAFTGFDFKDGCEVIGEAEVSDDVVATALAFVRAKAELDQLNDALVALLG